MAKAKQNLIQVIPQEQVINKIYVIRGVKVMLDRDLAIMYGVVTKVFNQSVACNPTKNLTIRQFMQSIKLFKDRGSKG